MRRLNKPKFDRYLIGVHPCFAGGIGGVKTSITMILIIKTKHIIEVDLIVLVDE